MRSPEYFREKADEARAIASEMRTHEAREAMLHIAEQYDELARLAEREETRGAGPSPAAALSRPS